MIDYKMGYCKTQLKKERERETFSTKKVKV